MQSGKFPTCFVVMNKYFDILIKHYVIFVLLSWVVMYLWLGTGQKVWGGGS